MPPESTMPSAEALATCSDEPIRTPNAIQPHGFLLVLEEASLAIEQVSENIVDVLGHDIDSLLGRDFRELVTAEQRPAVHELFSALNDELINPLPLTFVSTSGVELNVECVVTAVDAGTLTVEVEIPPTQLGTGPSLDDYFRLLRHPIQLDYETGSVERIAAIAAKEIKGFTGYDRVMIYRFAPDFHGEVIAEELEDGMTPYLGLHFPESDIPSQARELYRRYPVRLLGDVDAGTSIIHPTVNPRTGKVVDMSHLALRSMSPIHLQYLRNMGVAASYSISLTIRGELWGLISCHHRSTRLLGYGARSTCALYGAMLAARIDAAGERNRRLAEEAARRSVQSFLSTLDTSRSLAENLRLRLQELIEMSGADGGAVLEASHVHGEGSCPDDAVVLGIPPAFADDPLLAPPVMDDAYERVPITKEAQPRAAGLVTLKLGQSLWLMLFRDETVFERNWGGEPKTMAEKAATGLSPRTSFDAWLERVAGHSLPWDEWLPVAMDDLRNGLAGFLVSRDSALSRSNEQLRQFSGVIAHEVRSQLQPPLLALKMAGEAIGPETPGRLVELIELGVSSLDSLSEFASEMLEVPELDDAEQDLSRVDLAKIARVAAQQAVAATKSPADCVVVADLPLVKGSPPLLYHLISNLVRNALIHGPRDAGDVVSVTIAAQEAGTSERCCVIVKDNGRGIPEELKPRLFEQKRRRPPQSDRPGSGIGLGLVKQLIEQTGGSIRLESLPGEGTTFFVELPSGV